MKFFKQVILLCSLIIAQLSFNQSAIAGAILTVTMNNIQSSKIIWQCADITECVERIITRVEEQGECDNRVQKIEIVSQFIPGFDDVREKNIKPL